MIAADRADVVVVGGGPAGLGVVRGYREAGGTGSVVLLSADRFPPYARPALSKDYLRDETGADELALVPGTWYAEHGVDLRLSTVVTEIDRENRQVVLSDGDVIGYDRLALATGSSPTPLPLPGGDTPGLIYVRDRHSAEAMRGVAESARNVVVVGSGFIGCEVAASLARRGCAVVLVTDEERPHASRLGADAGDRVRGWLEREGVHLVLGDGVAAIRLIDDDGWRVELASGRTLAADAVIAGGGSHPNLGLAEAAGLAVENGGVRTDPELRTSDPTIWAAGDIAYAHHPAAGRALRVEHWGEAETMGEIVGGNLAAEVTGAQRRRWDTAPGFWSGIGEKTLKYCAWGDGHDDALLVERPDGWAVWYLSGEVLVGVLAHEWDEAYEQGRELIERGATRDQLGALARPS